MKIRQGFVSNSSSSSFILVGIKLDDSLNTEELAKKYIKEEVITEYIGSDIDKYTGDDSDGWWNDLWYECAYDGDFIDENLDFINDDDRSFLGKILADDDDDLEDGEYSISELSKIADGFGFEDCKIYFGTRQC